MGKEVVGRKGHDLAGQVYGRLTVVHHAGSDNHGRRLWYCTCSCGGNTYSVSTSLRAGNSTSCGCLQKELARASVTNNATPQTVKHGLSGHPLYKSWARMIDRCENPKNPKFQYWGGRGVSVCPEWRTNFPAFYEWALAHGWSPGLQLDRDNSDKNYSPDNCQWLTSSAHSKKTRAESA